MPLSQEDKDHSLKRLGAFAGMLEDCSALVIIHVSDGGKCTFHRSGNVFAQAGAARFFEAGLRTSLVEADWDPDEDEATASDE